MSETLRDLRDTRHDRVFRFVLITCVGAEIGAGVGSALYGGWITAGTAWLSGVMMFAWVMMRKTWVRIGYDRGWFEGRNAYRASMEEAQRRGLTPGQWYAGELERDFADLGLDPYKHLGVERPSDG